MGFTEHEMKQKGEVKTWKQVKTPDGEFKKVYSTQIGIKMLFDDAIRIQPDIIDWINNTSAKTYRRELTNAFKDENKILEKTVQTLLFLSGSVNIEKIKNKKTNRHKRVNTLKNKVMPDLSFEVVWRFTEVVIDLSKYFEIEKILNYDQDGFKWSFSYKSTLPNEIIELLTIESATSFYPLPITSAPLDWELIDGEIVGGYKSFQYEMVRANQKVNYKNLSPKIFNAINYIQSVPWRINEKVRDAVVRDLKVPKKEDFILTEYPDPTNCEWDVDINDENLDPDKKQSLISYREKFREVAELYKAEVSDYDSAYGKYRSVKMAAEIAEKYVGQTIYFPHSFDFRGRVYPIPICLNPQGSDAIKAMLEYDQGEPLDYEGAKWAFAYLASLYGDDKINFEERVERGKELIDANYLDADEPYQFLAHQLELQKVLEDPDLPFYGRIHLDACNSGSQFTSAITGDFAGCVATNVIPTVNETTGLCDRKDAYLLVAEKCKEAINDKLAELVSDKTLKSINQKLNDNTSKSSKEELLFFQQLMEKDGRKVCKTPVMVSNYGGTTGGRSELLWNMFREMKVNRKWINKSPQSRFSPTASRLSLLIGDAIKGVLNGGKAFETYIQKMNNLIAKQNRPIWWTTSDGFHVVHSKNKELKAKAVSCLLPGSRRVTRIIKKMYSDDVAVSKMRSAISPNYIHSLDAELLRRVALKMSRRGIENSDWIHDSFGCHPNYVSDMLQITKEEFLKLMKRKPLAKLDEELRSQMTSRKKKDKQQLDKIKIPNLRGFDVVNGGLDGVLESEWFFS